MKSYKSYLIGLTAVAAIGSLAACQDDFDDPTVKAPVATIQPNMTILELKQAYWNDATNYIDTIGVENGIDDGKNYVIAGRVISSDEAGNVFKSLVIQDETAALALSINSYNLYLKYRVGQEVVIDLKGMYIGKYNGLVQLGMPEWYANGNAWEATFMAPEFFQQHAQCNGFPEAAKIDTLEVNSFSELPSNPDGLQKWQSQLVKFNNVYFQNAGTQQFSEYHSSGVNQNIVDVNGSTLPVRTSGYSNFWNKFLPEGNGDVVCILSYYGTTGWQLMLNDYQGCMNFGNPTVAPGTEDNPYDVIDAIEQINNGSARNGWVKGYIVGAVAPEVESVKANSDIEWAADVVLDNTLVIGQTADTKDISNVLVIALPPNSDLRKYGNLVDNPDNYKKEIWVKGSFGIYMDTFGVLNNNGSADAFKIDGVVIDNGQAPDGNGTEQSPYNVQQVIAKNPSGNADNPDEKDVWVTGFIVGWADMSSTYYINEQTARFSVPATMNTNILIAPTPGVTDYKKCIGIQLPSGNVRKGLNLQDNPGNLGRKVTIKGNIAKYSGVPGLRSASQYVLDGDTPAPDQPTTGDPKGSGTASDPYNIAKALEVCKANGETSDVEVYTAGYVISGSIDTGFGNGTWVVADNKEGTGPTITFFRVKDFGGEKFTDANKVKVGDYLVVKAPLINFKGNTPETNYGTLISINGNTGGDTPVNPDPTGGAKGSGTATDPYNATKAIAVAQANGQTSTENVYTGGYVISGSIDTSFGNGTWDIADNADGTGSTIKVFRAKDFGNEKFTDANKVKVGDYIVVCAPLVNYMGNTPETNMGYLYSINGNTGGDTPVNPGPDPDPVTGNTADFNTFNGSKPSNTYTDYSTADGWKLVWGQVLAGATDVSNFLSTDASTLIPVVDGSKARKGSLTSPTIKGGIGTLTFTYGFPYKESKCQFTVNIKQNGAVVASDVVTLNSITKGTAMKYSHDFNVKGEFVIEIINDAYSQSSSNNADRIAITGLAWSNF